MSTIHTLNRIKSKKREDIVYTGIERTNGISSKTYFYTLRKINVNARKYDLLNKMLDCK